MVLTYEGRNLSDNTNCGTGTVMLIADPLLGELADNGGPTRTRAFAFNSPALNAATNCNVTVDQRHVPRDAACDLGAFEFTDFARVSLTIDGNTKVDPTTGRATLTGTIRCTPAGPFRLTLELHQDQTVNGQVVDVHSASDIPVSCTTTPKSRNDNRPRLPQDCGTCGLATIMLRSEVPPPLTHRTLWQRQRPGSPRSSGQSHAGRLLDCR